jgi:TPR repeat protein
VDEHSLQKTSIDTDDANALFALYQEKGGIKILRKAAKLGHAEAQYQLGLHLLELHQDTPLWKKAIKAVKGTKTNKEKAMEWFKKAAKQGHADAKRMLKK